MAKLISHFSASPSSSQVLAVVCMLSSSGELQWRDGVKILSQEEVLLHLLALAQKSAHRLEKTLIQGHVQKHL